MKQIIKYFLILVSLSFFIVIGGGVNYAMPSYDETYGSAPYGQRWRN